MSTAAHAHEQKAAEFIIEETGSQESGVGSQREDPSVNSVSSGVKKVCRGIKLRDGRTVRAQAVIITTGTFLNGLIHCGEQTYPAGRSGEPPSVLLGWRI